MNEILEKLMQINRIFFFNLILNWQNMANLLIIDVLSNHVAANYNEMRKLICSIHNESNILKAYADKLNYFCLNLF